MKQIKIEVSVLGITVKLVWITEGRRREKILENLENNS